MSENICQKCGAPVRPQIVPINGVNPDLMLSKNELQSLTIETIDDKNKNSNTFLTSVISVYKFVTSEINKLFDNFTTKLTQKADLVNGKIRPEQLPPLAIGETFTVNNEQSMLYLDAQQGDICVRSDLSRTYRLVQDPASVRANWVELLAPTGAVTSVNGLIGAVTIDKATVGLGAVNNTADSEKNVYNSARLGGFLAAEFVKTSQTMFYRGEIINGINANNLYTSGFWEVTTANGSGNTNFAENSSYGFIEVIVANRFLKQIQYCENTGKIYIRMGYVVTNPTEGRWTSWKQVSFL